MAGEHGATAVLFDIDGTLVDSNFHHAVAWRRAFLDAGQDVACWRIHDLLGRSGDELIVKLVGDEVADARGQQVKDGHERYFGEFEPTLRATPGVRDLLQAITDRGWPVVLASSAGKTTLQLLRRVLDIDDLVSEVTSSADAERGKPHPDIVSTAMARVGVDAQHAIFVGDAVWDIEAGHRAGVPTVAVLSGGVSREELQNAGAAAVYDDPRDVLDHLDEFIALVGSSH